MEAEPVVQPRIARELVERHDRPRFRIPAAEDQGRNAGLDHRADAHRARLERDVDLGIGQPVKPEPAPGATEREDLGMCRRIVRPDRLVVPAGDDPSTDDQDRSHGDLTERLRSLGFGDRHGHPFSGVGQQRAFMVARGS